MATLTAEVTLVCDNQSEYDAKEAALDGYSPAPGEPELSDLVKDSPNLTLNYTLTSSN